MRYLALCCTLLLFTTGCDSSESGKDDILRIINSLAEEGITVQYSSRGGDGGSGTVTLRHQAGLGSETVVNVSYIENDVFTFTAMASDIEGSKSCTVGSLAVENGAADLLVYREQTGPTTVVLTIDCAANWAGN